MTPQGSNFVANLPVQKQLGFIFQLDSEKGCFRKEDVHIKIIVTIQKCFEFHRSLKLYNQH